MIWRKLAVCLVVLAAATATIGANGSKGYRIEYSGTARIGGSSEEPCRFLVEVEPILFQITTVQSKYRVMRININNHSQTALRLSMEKDSILVRTESGQVAGILDFSEADSTWWNGLPRDLRKALAYPDQAPIDRQEEENVFVFVPVSELAVPPEEIVFRIDSLPEPQISLRRRSIAGH